MEEEKKKAMSQKGKVGGGRSFPKPQGCAPPGASAKYSRGKLGESLVQKTPGFDLSDPYMNVTPGAYSSLHDPYLKTFFRRRGKKQHLLKQGLITEDEKVLCSRKEFRRYTDYTRAVQNKWRKPSPSETTNRPGEGVAGQVERSVLQNQQESTSGTSRTSVSSPPLSRSSEAAVAETPEEPIDNTMEGLVEVSPDLTGTQKPVPISVLLPVTQTYLDLLTKLLEDVRAQVERSETSEASDRLNVLEKMLQGIPELSTSSSSSQGTSTSSPSDGSRGTAGAESVEEETPRAEDQAQERETDSPASALHQHVEEDRTPGPALLGDRVGDSSCPQMVSSAPPEPGLDVDAIGVNLIEPASRDEATDEPKKKQKNRVRGFFRRAWKEVKKAFCCCSCNMKIHPA